MRVAGRRPGGDDGRVAWYILHRIHAPWPVHWKKTRTGNSPCRAAWWAVGAIVVASCIPPLGDRDRLPDNETESIGSTRAVPRPQIHSRLRTQDISTHSGPGSTSEYRHRRPSRAARRRSRWVHLGRSNHCCWHRRRRFPESTERRPLPLSRRRGSSISQGRRPGGRAGARVATAPATPTCEETEPGVLAVGHEP